MGDQRRSIEQLHPTLSEVPGCGFPGLDLFKLIARVREEIFWHIKNLPQHEQPFYPARAGFEMPGCGLH